MSDAETLAAYALAAERYAEAFARGEGGKTPSFDQFLPYLPAGGRVLDWGCGPGHWAARFQAAGFDVEATDASPEMAKLAKYRFGIDVRVEPFAALNAQALYDGIWAHFSLLHAPRNAFPGHLAQIARALKPRGHTLLGLKLGKGEKRDDLGRFYTFYRQEELQQMLTEAGLTLVTSRTGSEAGLTGEVSPFVILVAHA